MKIVAILILASSVASSAFAVDFDTRSSAIASPPLTESTIRTSGFATLGDGGGGLYVRCDVGHPPTIYPGGFVGIDGSSWRLVADSVNPQQFGACLGAMDDTAAFKECLAFNAPIRFIGKLPILGVSISLAGTSITGVPGKSTIVWTDPKQHLLNVSADDCHFEGFTVQGTADPKAVAADTVAPYQFSTFAVFTSQATPEKRLTIKDISLVGCTNGFKFDGGCDDGRVINCRAEQMVGTTSGHGYFMLAGGCKRGIIQGCSAFFGGSSGGRHMAYISAGCSDWQVIGNYCEGSFAEAIPIYAVPGQPANVRNSVRGNILVGCNTGMGIKTGAISVFGLADRNTIEGNLIDGSGGNGIHLEGIANGGFLTNTSIGHNRIFNAGGCSVFIIGANGGRCYGNESIGNGSLIPGSSAAFTIKTRPAVDLTDKAAPCDDWSFLGNSVIAKGTPHVQMRAAFRNDPTVPVASRLMLIGNSFQAGPQGIVDHTGAPATSQ